MANNKKDNGFGAFIKEQRKLNHITQVEFAMKSGLGLRFVRELEQGKQTLRLDKINQALAMFGCRAGVVREESYIDESEE